MIPFVPVIHATHKGNAAMQPAGERSRHQLAGMRGLSVVWVGQLISLLGTGMTRFAITIWVWQITGEATALALVGFFSYAPVVAMSPIAGALVDRWNRKAVMAISDLGAGLSTVIVLVLFTTGRLEIWHLYVTGAIAGAFEAFQFPALSAAISGMLRPSQYTRANGMMSLAEYASSIAAPIFAGILLAAIGIAGILVIDIVTFLIAVSLLALVFIPQPDRSSEGVEAAGTLWSESIYGFRYIWRRPSLFWLQSTFLFVNLTGTLAVTLIAPMILARSGNNELALATVQSALGVGGVAGGLLLAAWGGPQRRIHGVLLGFIGVGLLGQCLLGIGRDIVIWAIAAFFLAFFLPFINGSNRAIWQAKVAPDVQGRVFAASRLLAQISAPVAMLLAGPLADRVFEPAMQPGGALADAFGWLAGTGPGAGMGLLTVLMGLMVVLTGFAGYSFQLIRDVETLLPDHQAAPQAEQAG